MADYTMIIDLNKCIRSRTCYVACKNENKILAHPKDREHPYEYYRLRYVEWEWGKYPRVKRAFIPILCMHCEDPLCLRFCPVDAIVIRKGGIVVIDKARCNGCGACAQVCPYGALYITPDGKADGCDFCVNRLDVGLKPRCVEECPSGKKTIIFGDLEDPKDDTFKLVSSGIAKPILFENVKKTRVYYIPSVNEGNWNKLPYDPSFLMALTKRKRDLPPLKGVL
jgi:tetrathionate reductase subunit B